MTKPIARVSESEVAKHDTVTREIIMGTLATAGDEGWGIVRISHEITNLLKRRGYRPQIRCCNQLIDGTNV